MVIGLMSLIFEIREVPDYNWYKRYKHDSKEPYGLWLFSELLKHRYGSDNIIYNESDTLYLSEGNNDLYLVIGEKARYNDKQNDDIMEYVERGNDILIIASYTDLRIPMDSFYSQELYLIEDQQNKANYDHILIDEYGDTLDNTQKYYVKDDKDVSDGNQEEQNIADDSYDDSYYENPADSILFIESFYNERSDSIVRFDHMPFDSTASRYSYSHYHNELKKLEEINIPKFKIPEIRIETLNGKELLFTTDSLSFFIKLDLGKGHIYLHSMPVLLSNIGTQQEYFLDHAEYVLSHFDPDKIIVDRTRMRFNVFEDEIKKSPIAFILKTPSLAWAYYLTLASILAFVIFRSKRLQRIIPLKEKNENTSLQYIKTLSTLYQGHEQNNKLVIHMRDVFFNKIKNKYFLDHTIEGYIELLSKKTKISEKEITTLLHKFDSAKNSTFTDDQLIVLHNQIESFHKKSK